MIFNVQRYSTHDGEGIRSVIFYKGCPLSCQWCSNPESQSFGYSLMYDERLCRSFEDCIKPEPRAISRGENNGLQIDLDLLEEPEKLRDICTSKALTISGESKSVDELMTEIEKDIPFYRENGGVTLSGGEPLSQGEDLTALLRTLKKRKINVNMETTLHVSWDKVTQCIGWVDTFLVDLKHTQRNKFRSYTKGDATLVMDNLVNLSQSGASVIVRIPVIPGFNHTEDEMKRMIDFVAQLKTVREIHLLPYHTYGAEKYKMLGMEYPYGGEKPVEERELAPYIQYAGSAGLQVKIGG